MREKTTLSALRMTSVPVLLILFLVLLLALYCINTGPLTIAVQADMGTTGSGDVPPMAEDSMSAAQPLLGLRCDAIEYSNP